MQVADSQHMIYKSVPCDSYYSIHLYNKLSVINVIGHNDELKHSMCKYQQ